jgi:hypothetical protein
MGRKAQLKKQRKLARLRESWDHFLSIGFLSEVRKLILTSGATPDSCIGSTKVLCQLGESFGLRVEPLVVEAYVYNSAFVMHFANHGFDITPADVERIGGEGGFYIVLGSRREEDKSDDPKEWNGHLVAVVYPPKGLYETPHVIDISLDQAHRPARGLLLQEPVVFPIPSKRFLSGEEDAIGLTEVRGIKMCMAYKSHPDAKDYEISPDWQRDYEARVHDNVDFDELPNVVPTEGEEAEEAGAPDGTG